MKKYGRPMRSSDVDIIRRAMSKLGIDEKPREKPDYRAVSGSGGSGGSGDEGPGVSAGPSRLLRV